MAARKKATCKHAYPNGATAWHAAPMRADLYQQCGVCHDVEYKPGMAPPKPKRTRKPKIQQAALIVLPPPTRHTINLPDGVAVHHGLCLDVLKTLPDCSVDAIVTDPPSGTFFMGRKWDKANGGRDGWIAERQAEFEQALRVLKPGAHAVVWALPRTSHWTATALENAGFEVRDVVHHLFGSGYPKSVDVSKQIDKHLGAERKVTGIHDGGNGYKSGGGSKRLGVAGGYQEPAWSGEKRDQPATPQAEELSGYGTAMKPSAEHWILCRKPLEGTIAENALAWGTGGLNIDACRVGTDEIKTCGTYEGDGHATQNLTYREGFEGGTHTGRWPAHLVLSHTPDCVMTGTKRIKAITATTQDSDTPSTLAVYGQYKQRSGVHHSDADGMETVEAWQCAEGCPVAELDAQSDGASHFFTQLEADPAIFHYFAKPSRNEKEKGLIDARPRSVTDIQGRKEGSAGAANGAAGSGRTGGAKNFHTTVKSVALMKWLISLVAPPRRAGEDAPIILDMFAGSGTTGVACIELGVRCILIEADMDDEGYIDLIYARLDHARQMQGRKIAA